MPGMRGGEGRQPFAAEWRAAIIEVEQARQAYAAAVARDGDDEERWIDRVWLRLWRAERRRDDLLKRSE